MKIKKNNKRMKSEIELLSNFTIINISEGGMLIETNTGLNVGSIHVLKLPYKQLSVKGLVKRVEQEKKEDKEIYRIAFQFVEVNSEQEKVLKDFINSIKKEQNI